MTANRVPTLTSPQGQLSRPRGALLSWKVALASAALGAIVAFWVDWLNPAEVGHWTLLATVGLLLVTWRYTIIAEAQWVEVATANALTHESIHAAHRPWVLAGKPKVGTGRSLAVEFRNQGQGPAFRILIGLKAVIRPRGPVRSEDLDVTVPIDGGVVLGPDGPEPRGVEFEGEGWPEGVKKGTHQLLVFGTVTYCDQFGYHGLTRFCYVYETEVPGEGSPRWYASVEGNEAT